MKSFRTAFAALVVCVILLVGVGVVWESMVWRHYGYANMPWKEVSPMMWPGMFWGGGMWIFPLIGLVVFLFVIYFVFTRVFIGGSHFCGGGGQGAGSPGQQTPLDILKIRYAKGEITREEFERMKKDIGEDGKS